MTSLTEMQIAATNAFTAYSEFLQAVNKASRPGTDEYRLAIATNRPARVVRVGGLAIEAIAPQNRTMLRQAHLRFNYWANDRKVSAAAFVVALAKTEALGG